MFIINSTRIGEDDQTFWSNVTFTLKDETELTVDVAVFCPKDKDYILQSIANREITEQQKYDALTNNIVIKDDMEKTAVKVAFELVDGAPVLKSVKVG